MTGHHAAEQFQAVLELGSCMATNHYHVIRHSGSEEGMIIGIFPLYTECSLD